MIPVAASDNREQGDEDHKAHAYFFDLVVAVAGGAAGVTRLLR